MSDGLRTLNVDNRRDFDPRLVRLLNLGMFLLGECPRFPESEDFVVANCDRPLSHLSRVTLRLDGLIHVWSFLSKLAFKFFIAIVEFDLHFRESRASFDEARKLMHTALGKGGDALELDDNLHLKTLQLDFCGADGNFNLRTLLGSYLRVLKCDKHDIIRIIMRTKHGVTNILHEYPPKVEEQNRRKLSPEEEIAAAHRKNEDDAEYVGWGTIRDVDGLKLIDVLLNDLPIDEVQ